MKLKEFRLEVTLVFEVKAKNKKKAKVIVEKELKLLNGGLVIYEDWHGISTAVEE